MGMPNITFRCQMFRGDWDQVWSQMRMLWLMEGLCRVNQTHLRQFDEFQRRGLVERGYPSVYRSGLHYETEKGTEIWPDIPSLLMGTMGKGNYPGHWGDCLPATTSVLRVNDHLVVPIGDLASGDQIVGDGKDTTVTAHAITGMKTILELELDNKKMFRGSPEHRVFSQDGAERRVEDVEVGDLLRTPTTGARVVAIREVEPELCCDITTDTGRFYLPESDLVVHNCEDLACYRVAELRELPEHYERQAPWNKSKTECADPRYPQPAQTTMTPAGPVALSGAGDDPWAGWKKVQGRREGQALRQVAARPRGQLPLPRARLPARRQARGPLARARHGPREGLRRRRHGEEAAAGRRPGDHPARQGPRGHGGRPREAERVRRGKGPAARRRHPQEGRLERVPAGGGRRGGGLHGQRDLPGPDGVRRRRGHRLVARRAALRPALREAASCAGSWATRGTRRQGWTSPTQDS